MTGRTDRPPHPTTQPFLALQWKCRLSSLFLPPPLLLKGASRSPGNNQEWDKQVTRTTRIVPLPFSPSLLWTPNLKSGLHRPACQKEKYKKILISNFHKDIGVCVCVAAVIIEWNTVLETRENTSSSLWPVSSPLNPVLRDREQSCSLPVWE